MVEAERKSNAMIADAEAKSTQILAEAIERARQLAGETEDLKKKTRVFHQRLSLMLETQLEQVKSEEWEEILKPFLVMSETNIQQLRKFLMNKTLTTKMKLL